MSSVYVYSPAHLATYVILLSSSFIYWNFWKSVLKRAGLARVLCVLAIAIVGAYVFAPMVAVQGFRKSVKSFLWLFVVPKISR